MNEKEETMRLRLRSSLDKHGQVPCAAAHRIAEELEVKPLQVGKQADAIGIRISRCQLGLFGYTPKKGTPGFRVAKKLDNPPETASEAVRKTAEQGRIPCLALWRLAAQYELTRRDMGDIAETLELKVTPCQLGCF
ncbi:MAG: hypothetical protein JW820_05385 [Spirochaetales bacterium]|nr:hypothetical protein [Spirochaetales bacterium]